MSDLSVELRSLVSTLPRLISAALAPNTTSKYQRAWCHWKTFCINEAKITPRPADPFYIALYFNFLLTTRNTRGSIVDAYFGIRWGHHSAGFHSPTDHPFVQLAYEGAKRLAKKAPGNKKDPMTSKMIQKIFEHYGKDPSLKVKRFLLVCILGFAGFFRTDEMLGIKVSHISFHESHMAVFLPHSKTDQEGEGHTVCISVICSPCCPVFLVKEYIKIGGLSSADYLICKLVATKKGHKTVGSHPLSYSRTRKIFLELTKPLFPKQNLGLHGLRAGGASTCATNKVSDRMISKHGRWISEKARDRYIRPTLEEQLEVTKNLGL